jgi:hypothetical protein
VEHLRQPAGRVVPFEHQHSSSGGFGKSGRRAEPSDAGSDHDRVEWASGLELVVWRAD